MASHRNASGVERELVARGDNDVIPHDTAQMVEPLSKRAPSFVVTELRPEQREEGIATYGTGRRAEREVREQRDALGLDSRGGGGGPVFGKEANATEGKKLAHDGLRYAPGRRPATRRRGRRYRAVTGCRRSPTTTGHHCARVHDVTCVPPPMKSAATMTTPMVVTLGLTMLVACREGQALRESVPALASTGAVADLCVGDSLRPSAAAPAQGLWLYDGRPSRERVVAMIGPARQEARALVVTRPVESMEVSAAGDTIRHRLAAAIVSLELLPSIGGALGLGSVADSAVIAHPAATYAVSPNVLLAAYDPCVTSAQGPRIRYIRRDPKGRIVTDVMLRRASEQ